MGSFVLSLSFTMAVFLSCRLIGSSFLSVLVSLKGVFVMKGCQVGGALLLVYLLPWPCFCPTGQLLFLLAQKK